MDQAIDNIENKTSGNTLYFVLIPCAALAFYILDSNIYYTIAVTIFLHQFLSLYFNLGKKIPLRNLGGMMFSLNFLLSPVLMFFWLNPFVAEEYSMRGDPETYFSYAIPAMLLFLLGLNIMAKKKEEELDIKMIRTILEKFPNLPMQFIIVGFFASFIISSVPSEWEFVVLSIAYLKFIGMFLSILSDKPFNFFFLIITYGTLLVQSLASSMFNDLLNMLFFLGLYLSIRYQPSHLARVLGIVAGIFFVSFIQSIKFNLREKSTNSISDLRNLGEIFKESRSQTENISTEEKAASVIFRLSQGWVTSSTMEYYKDGGFPLQKGKHSMLILQMSVIPRILDPTRPLVGDGTWFNKYSGHLVVQGTSIALGILTDGFIDFGRNGIFVVFLFGLIINLFVKLYNLMDKHYKLAKIFLPICFFYVRPDTDTFSSLGAVLKTTFVLWIVLFITYKFFLQSRLDPDPELEVQNI